MKEATVVFVYYKEGKIKVLDFEEAKKQRNKMISENWFHAATIDPIEWIEYLYNQAEDKLLEIKLLGKELKF